MVGGMCEGLPHPSAPGVLMVRGGGVGGSPGGEAEASWAGIGREVSEASPVSGAWAWVSHARRGVVPVVRPFSGGRGEVSPRGCWSPRVQGRPTATDSGPRLLPKCCPQPGQQVPIVARSRCE